MATLDLPARLQILRSLLTREQASTQDELRAQMESLGHTINQSTVSRDLRRVGAIKIGDAGGRVVYRLPFEAPIASITNLGDLVRSIRHNGQLAVIQTDPGSASFIARHVDALRSELIMGTIAGDDAVFVAPAATTKIDEMTRIIQTSLRGSGGRA